jgi:hypothetical protein
MHARGIAYARIYIKGMGVTIAIEDYLTRTPSP